MSLLADRTPIYPRKCIGAEETYRTSMAEGVIYGAAECIQYQRTTNATVVERILAAQPPTAVGAIVDGGRRLPKEVRDVIEDPVARVLSRMKSVPPEPFVERLVQAKSPEETGDLLALALRIHGNARSAQLPAPLESLFASPQPKSRLRAALVALLILPPDEGLAPRRRAIEIVNGALASHDGEAAAADLTAVGENALPLLPALTRRLSARGEYRGWTLRALAGLGPAAAVALPAVEKRLPLGSESEDACEALVAMGPKARAATDELVRLGATGSGLKPASAALDAIGASLNGAQWRLIQDRYGQECKDAGSIPFFSLSRDNLCADIAQHLQRVAERSGQKFKEVGWER